MEVGRAARCATGNLRYPTCTRPIFDKIQRVVRKRKLSTSLTSHKNDEFLTILSKKEELVYMIGHDRQAALIATGRVGCAGDAVD